MVLDTGVFTISTTDITMSTRGVFNLGTGIFNIKGSNLAIYGSCQQGNIIDALAIDAPYPPPDFFVPTTDPQPATILSPDQEFGNESATPNAIYLTYYNPVTLEWNDVGYESQYPGQTIPTDLKQDVADQTFLYNQYVVAIALWQAEYDRQKIFQWPYYWAQNVALATGSIPVGTENCGCDCHIALSPDTIPAANQSIVGGTGVSMDDEFDIGGTSYTTGQIFAMVLKNLAQP
jgi:hypothetical protein